MTQMRTLLLAVLVLGGAAAEAGAAQPPSARSTFTLEGGGRIVIPKGAVPRGTRITASYGGRPATGRGQIGTAVRLTLSGRRVRLRKPLRLELPAAGGRATVIKTYRPQRRRWTAVRTSFDPNRNLVTARIRRLPRAGRTAGASMLSAPGWWNSFVADAGKAIETIGSHAVQVFGEKIGTRAEAPACVASGNRSNSLPAWVASVSITADSDMPLLGCAQSEGSDLAVELANNRPYGVVLEYGAPVRWGWTQAGFSLREIAFSAPLQPKDGLYLPALGYGSIGLAQGSWTQANFTARPSGLSIMADLMESVLEAVGSSNRLASRAAVARVIRVMNSDCLHSLVDLNVPADAPGLARFIRENAGCIQRILVAAARKGLLDGLRISSIVSLENALEAFKYGQAIMLANKYLELIRDNVLDLHGGFGVTAKAGGGGQTPPLLPTPRTYPEKQGRFGVDTFLNYSNASGKGPRIAPKQVVEVSCKVYAPSIQSVQPDGYWYRIASAPWNNQYYAPANTFYNGDPEEGPYTHNTDFAVPDC
jgi:hypothetical protein